MARSARSKGLKHPAYRKWIQSLPCIVCMLDMFTPQQALLEVLFADEFRFKNQSECAHVGERGMSQKCSDMETIPLCGHDHHREGRESAHKLQKKFWVFHDLNREEIITALNERYEQEHAK